MNNHERGIYQPLTENLPIYDLADDEQDDEEERSRLPILIVFSLLVLAAFAGVVWLAYNQGVARGRAGAAVIISAPEGPARTAPAETGGAATSFTGLKVYNQPLPPDQEAQNSALAPAPAVDLPPAPTSNAASNAAPAEPPPVRLNPPDTTPSVAAAPSPAPKAAAPTPVAPALAAAAPVKSIPAKPAPIAAAPKPAPQMASAVPPSVKGPAALTHPPAAPAAGAKSAVAGGAVLQIGAFTSEALATGAWTAFKNHYGDIAATASEDIQKVDLGPKGTWYRLRIGPFADKGAASGACVKLKAEGGNCFVAAP